MECRGRPSVRRYDNDPEYLNGALLAWAEANGIRKPGKPQQTLRLNTTTAPCVTRWLGQYLFDSIDEVQESANRWLGI